MLPKHPIPLTYSLRDPKVANRNELEPLVFLAEVFSTREVPYSRNALAIRQSVRYPIGTQVVAYAGAAGTFRREFSVSGRGSKLPGPSLLSAVLQHALC